MSSGRVSARPYAGCSLSAAWGWREGVGSVDDGLGLMEGSGRLGGGFLVAGRSRRAGLDPAAELPRAKLSAGEGLPAGAECFFSFWGQQMPAAV